LREPRTPAYMGSANGDHACVRILSQVNPIRAPCHVGRERASGGSKRESHVCEAGLWTSLISKLEQTNIGGPVALPAQLVISVPFEFVGTIGGKQSTGGCATGVPREERFIERTAVVRGVPAPPTIADLGAGKAGVIAPEMTIGVREHPLPVAAAGPGQAKFHSVVTPSCWDHTIWRAIDRTPVRSSIKEIPET